MLNMAFGSSVVHGPSAYRNVILRVFILHPQESIILRHWTAPKLQGGDVKAGASSERASETAFQPNDMDVLFRGYCGSRRSVLQLEKGEEEG